MNNRYSNNSYRKRPEDPIRAGLLINEQIRYQDVRLLDVDGNPVGVMNSKQAIRMAYDQGLDLVEVTASATPPVVRIVDLNKWIYNLKRSKKEQDKKKQNKKKAVGGNVKSDIKKVTPVKRNKKQINAKINAKVNNNDDDEIVFNKKVIDKKINTIEMQEEEYTNDSDCDA